MKKLRQSINVRRDRRLRKWCVKIVGNQEGLGYGMKLIEEVYLWIKDTKQ